MTPNRFASFALALIASLVPSLASADDYDWDIEPKGEPSPRAPAASKDETPPDGEAVTLDIDAPSHVHSELRARGQTIAACDGRCRWVVARGHYVLDVDGDGVSHARHKTRVEGDLVVHVTPGSPTEMALGRATWIVGSGAALVGLSLLVASGMCGLGDSTSCDANAQRRTEIVGGVVGGVGLAMFVTGLVLDLEGRTGIDVFDAKPRAARAWRPRIAFTPTRGGAFGVVGVAF